MLWTVERAGGKKSSSRMGLNEKEEHQSVYVDSRRIKQGVMNVTTCSVQLVEKYADDDGTVHNLKFLVVDDAGWYIHEGVNTMSIR